MADESLKGKISTFLFTSVLAGLVTTAFNYKSWSEQARLDLVKSSLTEAAQTFDEAAKLMAARNYQAFRVVRYIPDPDQQAFNAEIAKLDAAVANWNLNYPELLQDFQFSLEIGPGGGLMPYSSFSTAGLEKRLRCNRPFDANNEELPADWNSPTWLLASLHQCYIRSAIRRKATELRGKLFSPSTRPQTAIETAARMQAIEPTIKELDDTISDLETHANETMVAAKKAIQRIRNATRTRSYLDYLRSW
jgi:hypothetical protein